MEYDSDTSELSISSPPDGYETKIPQPTPIDDDSSTFKPDDIYNQYTDRRRKLILFTVASASFLMPVTDTVYLPSLPVIQEDLNTSYSNVSLTIAIYTVVLGLMPLIWGPSADYFGRKRPALVSMVIYMVSTLICIFVPNIALLIIFRVTQAMGVSSLFLIGSVVIADTWRPHERGYAMGIFNIPLLVGPIIGPVVGGAIATGFGWRATFVFLVIISALLFIAMIFLPETLPYKFYEKDIKSKHPNQANPFPTPIFLPPWKPLEFFKMPSLIVVTLASGFGFLAIYVIFVILPLVLAEHYGLSELFIGLCYLPLGVGAMTGSLIGGRVTDKLNHKYRCTEGGMIAVIIGILVMQPGLLVCGWVLQYPQHLAILLAFSSLIGFGLTFLIPGVITFAILKKADAAAAIIGCLQFGQFLLGGVGIFAGASVGEAVGNGPMFTGISVLMFLSIVPLAYISYKGIENAKKNPNLQLSEIPIVV